MPGAGARGGRVVSAGDMATQKQKTAIAAGLGAAGASDRALRLAVISSWVGCPIASMNDLMLVEARYIIDFIKKEEESGELAGTVEKARAGMAVA